MRSLIAVAAAVILCATTCHADKSEEPSPQRFGCGIVINGFPELPVLIANQPMFTEFVPAVRVCLQVSEGARLEPEVGFLRTKTSRGDDYSSLSVLRLGGGLLWTAHREQAVLYGGVRGGWVRVSSDDSGEDGESENSFYVGPVLGGEYFPIQHLSLGGEAMFEYFSYTDESDYYRDPREYTMFALKMGFVVRWYF